MSRRRETALVTGASAGIGLAIPSHTNSRREVFCSRLLTGFGMRLGMKASKPIAAKRVAVAPT